MPLRYFDPLTGDSRDLTTADLEELMLVRDSHGRIMTFLNSERNLLADLLRAHRAKHMAAHREGDPNG